MSARSSPATWLVALALGGLLGCPKAAEEPTPAPGPTAPVPAGLSGTGHIKGHVHLAGTAPAEVERPSKLAFPECSRFGMPHPTLQLSKDNGVAEAFVWIKDGLPAGTYPVPTTPVVLDQRGCEFEPHVFGVQVGQPVILRNSDPFLHNAHALSGGFNVPMPKEARDTVKHFDHVAVPTVIGCDVHGWMRAYAGVVPHPFFAVTDAAGAFDISGLPDGHYTVELWQERLGRTTETVEVRGGAAVALDVQFKPTL